MHLDGTVNERDLGGMVTADNRRIRKGLFLRTDSLDRLTDNDLISLRDKYKVSIVIDLRNEEESGQKPDRMIEGARYSQIPLFVMAQAGVTREEDTVEMTDGVPDMENLYRIMVASDKVSQKLGNALRLVMNNTQDGRQKCSLFHCVAGKDRTGILAMLILGILGVSEEDIMEDYLLTNVTGQEIAGKIADDIKKLTGNAEMAERVLIAYTANESFLMSALDYIHSEYGTIPEYCKGKLKISEEEMEAFRERVLEPA